MADPDIPPIPINSLVAYDAMPQGGVYLVSLPHPTIPNERVFGALDVTAFVTTQPQNTTQPSSV